MQGDQLSDQPVLVRKVLWLLLIVTLASAVLVGIEIILDYAGSRGLLLEPGGEGPAPAILYIHAHGSRYDIGAREVVDGRDALAGPMGPELARAGFRRIEQTGFQQSLDPRLALDRPHHAPYSLYMDAVKA